ncbi:transposase [Nostoc sp. T09]|uniref:transposase n=1 Tax=Nostoc sp. T09 TaxID=1932621 RepID=UPI000A3BD928|nr:transposase [Nostoc sp. T09]OUL19697.1 transposase [Nostoc sp. T09]
MLSAIFEQFVQESPISVMARGLMERVFAPARMDKLFENHAQVQYQQELLFSSQVDLMSLVVCGIQKSVHAAYRATAANLIVSTTALYNKLCGVELSVSQALVRETAQDLRSLISSMGGEQPNPLPGYQLRIVDGTCLAATEHRLNAIRSFAAKALPGKAIVVSDPLSKLVIDIFPCADGHPQERSLFDDVLLSVKANEVWNGDRNFCTAKFLFKIASFQAFFVVRQHGSLGYQQLSQLKALGQTDTGNLFEQEVEINYEGNLLKCRRILLKLFKPTRGKEWEIAILTNLPPSDAPAAKIAQLYRHRWSLETLFQTVTENFHGEIQTLAYPKAALFSFSMALATYNILATLKAALGSVHGVGKIDAGLSDFYLVDEIQGTYRGMMIAIPAVHWQAFETFSVDQLVLVLQSLSARVELKRFLKAIRGVKKKREPLIVDSKHRHISTARLLNIHQNTQNKS